VLRFWNNDVLQQTEGVLAAIHEALHEDRGSSPTPSPSPPLPRIKSGVVGGGEQAELPAEPQTPLTIRKAFSGSGPTSGPGVRESPL
jgi:hypothetical protein